MIDSYKCYIRLFPDTLEVLEKLSKKYRLTIVTNSNKLFVEVLVPPIIHYFERVFSATSDFRMLKKNPETYKRVCEVLGVAPF